MDYSTTIFAVISFIESHVREPMSYDALESGIGLSVSHIRAVFAAHTGIPLARYILGRRIAHAAFALIHSHQSALEIALQYGFGNPDSFTRAFRRVMGMTPSEFRKRRPVMGGIRLYEGIFGVSERQVRLGDMQGNNNETTLYGVPKAGYGEYGAVTPYPICLKSVSNYLGEDVDYDYLICMCGAAFRMTWDTSSWNGGNVDICYTFDAYETPYRLGIEGLGREYNLLSREKDTTKEDFIRFIRAQIDQGRPLIAMGIIGPPEACVITGYRDGGDTLLGWNFFQHSLVWGSKETRFDPCGYFISSDWWENPCTERIISIGEKTGPQFTVQDIIPTAIEVLTGRQKDPFAKGILAYDAWKAAILNDRDFSDNLTLLTERMMCQGDAMDCIVDGRGRAASYFDKQAQTQSQPAYREIAQQFHIACDCVQAMAEILGGWDRSETQQRRLAQPEVRRQIAHLIDACKTADSSALDMLSTL